MSASWRNEYVHGHSWNTRDEIAFLERLGSHREHIKVRERYLGISEQKQDRLSLLFEYQAAMRRRAAWGDVDPVEVAEEVAAQIRACLDRPVRESR